MFHIQGAHEDIIHGFQMFTEPPVHPFPNCYGRPVIAAQCLFTAFWLVVTREGDEKTISYSHRQILVFYPVAASSSHLSFPSATN